MTRFHFVTPADRDVSAAPAGGLLYIDAAIGLDSNPGTTAAQPKRSLSVLPAALSDDQKVYVRNGLHYRRRKTARYGQNVFSLASSATAQATPGSVIGWGAGAPAFIGGDMLFTGWGAVSESEGNSYLAANGQQCTLPVDGSLWHGHFVGRDMLTPSYWTPNCPADLSTVSRWAFFDTSVNSYAWFDPTAANTQGFSASADGGGAEITRDPVKAALANSITMAVPAGTTGQISQTTIYVRHPALAAHYGSGIGPLGATLLFRGHPANLSYRAIITAYDEAASEITAVCEKITIGSGKRIRLAATGSQWRIMGAAFDVRQPGQYAVRINSGGATPPTAWRVVGDWMRGDSTMGRHTTVAQFSGTHYNLENLTFGRTAGSERPSISLTADPPVAEFSCHCVTFTGSSARLRTIAGTEFLPAASGAAMFYLGSTPVGTVDAVGLSVSRAWSGGGFRGPFERGTIDGITFAELGRTAVYFQTRAAGTTTITDMVGLFSKSVHGNGYTIYQAGTNMQLTGYSAFDCTRSVTTQISNAPTPTNRNNLFARLHVLSNMDIIAEDDPSGDEGTGVYQFRSDSGFVGSTIDRAILADGDGFQFYGAGANNGNVNVRRSYFSKLTIASNSATGNPPATEPAAFTDTVAANGGASLVTAQGGTATNVSQSNDQPWTGALSEAQWKALTVNADRTGYEDAALGAQRYNWIIPAYSESAPAPGAPVDLLLSVYTYYAKPQAGFVLTHVLKARPMSALSLPAGVGDNDLVQLDQGRIKATASTPGRDLSITVRETPQAKSGGVWSPVPGAARDTVFALAVVR